MEDKIIFETIRPEDAMDAAALEAVCFPPNEACSVQHMLERAQILPESFLVAKIDGKVIGYINALGTNSDRFSDDFFLDTSLHDPNGTHSMILGVAVTPEYQHQGIAHKMMEEFVKIEKGHGRKALVLTCHDWLVPFYASMGFEDDGLAESSWGGEVWHQMTYDI